MNKKDVLIGMFIGLVVAAIGICLFIFFATEYTIRFGIETLLHNGTFNKIVALGEVLNLPVFYLLLNKNQYPKAQGILLQAILVTVLTLLI